MDEFNEEHANILLSKEWLVKVDAQTSTPYLIKFHSSTVDLTCCLIITDTKRTWAEVLSSNQFARRWRQCNNNKPDEDDEEAWRTRHLDLLSRAHTLGGISELSFEVVQSNFGDFAFEFECNAFKWRWETLFVGYKTSADILSKHLIMPLISVNHLVFSSSDLVGNLPPNDLEQAIDKVARTARRTVDTHVKNALSKPRLATTIRRITAVFNFISDPPSIMTETEVPVLLTPPAPTPKITNPPSSNSKDDRRDAPTPSIVSKEIISPAPAQSSLRHNPINKVADDGSETESEEEAEEEKVPRPSIPASSSSSKGVAGSTTAMGVSVDQQQTDVRMRSPSPSREPSAAGSGPGPGGARSRSVSVSVAKGGTAPHSDTDSSPVRPIKKPKSKPRAATDSDEESEEERRKTAARIRSGGGGGGGPASRGGGVRQPIKRGGKRF